MKLLLLVQWLALLATAHAATVTTAPTEAPSVHPTHEPSVKPTVHPTEEPSVKPTVAPTVLPSAAPTVMPTVKPTVHPTEEPSVKPTVAPTVLPSAAPTVMPTVKPTVHPTEEPSVKPTVAPTIMPTAAPSIVPTVVPTQPPSIMPTVTPSVTPTVTPSIMPTVVPTASPSIVPTVAPSVTPTVVPTVSPSIKPTVAPTVVPTVVPTVSPTIQPTEQPSEAPTHHPTLAGPGWLLQYYYTTANTVDPVAVYGTREGECTQMNENPDYYYRLSCGINYAQAQLFNDSSCTQEIDDLEVNYREEYYAYWGAPVFSWGQARLGSVHYVTVECVTDSEQYSFTTTYENTTYAVTEYFNMDTEADDSMQCRNDYNAFAAYRKDFCFDINVFNSYWYSIQFTAEDDTFIRVKQFDDNKCEGTSFHKNLFQVDDCHANTVGTRDDDYKDPSNWGPNAQHRSSVVGEAHKNTLIFEMLQDAVDKMEGKKVMTTEEKDAFAAEKAAAFKAHQKAVGDKKAAAAADGKDVEGFDSTYDYYTYTSREYFNYGYGNNYYNDYYYSKPFNVVRYVTDYHMWVNVPALSEDTSSPMEWFTEMMWNYDVKTDTYSLGMINTRKTIQCMPFYWNNEILFNYKIICDTNDNPYDDYWYNWVHILQYHGDDWQCTGDFFVGDYEAGYFTVDDEIGRREFWSEQSFECSNTRFGSEFANLTESNAASYATEIFYPLTAWNESECVDSDDEIAMGVAFLEDFCFDFFVEYYTNDDYWIEMWMSFMYEANLENQNIEFTVYASRYCRDRFIHQTKEIDINTCSDEQPNSFYNPVWKPNVNSAAMTAEELEKTKSAVSASMKKMSANKYPTPFNRMLEKKAEKMTKHRNAVKKMAAKKTSSSEKEEASVYSQTYSYYYYYDDAEAFLNNRPGDMKNMWFTVPATPTIAPTLEPTLMPSEGPTIAPSMAPNPPTLRPTPLPGQPTAAPTHQTTYTFDVVQTLDGIDADTFNSNSNNTAAFEEAAAMAMPPLTSDNINVYSVEDSESGRRLRGLQSSSIDISYSVTYTVAETGYTDAQTAYNALTTSLTTAIVDTDLFDGYIQVAAAENNFNAPDLLSTTTNSYTATDAVVVGTDDDSKPTLHTHAKIIVGVLVGLGGGLIVIALIAFCIFGMGTEDSQTYSNPQNVNVGNSAAAVEMTSVDPTTAKGQI